MSVKFAGFPTAFVFEEPKVKAKKVRELLWGEWVNVISENPDGWCEVHTRGQDEWKKEGENWVKIPKKGWMKAENLQDKKLLEVYFVDIGQGDGCMIITPDGKIMLIDAGEEDNMWRFLKWKFNTKNPNNPPLKIQNTIISHSDSDHYEGFSKLFKDPRFEFENVFHNGLVERKEEKILGEIKNGYQTEVISTHAQLETILNDPAKVATKKYPNLLKSVSVRGTKIRMLCRDDKFMEGYEADKPLVIRVLAPIPETENGKRKLKRFDANDGKTKNGHSIVLKLEFGKLRMLLGGDLNTPAENYILKQYTGIDPETATEDQKKTIITEARKIFESDVAKACHHGAAEFTTLFLQAINPVATVISSGDNEPHAHPRPESLGAIGKYSRGERPLIYSTELARSAKESIKNPSEMRAEIDQLIELQKTATTDEQKKKIEKLKEDLKKKIERTVTVYGMINLRSDGEKVVIAQRLEEKAARGDWDYCTLKPNQAGVLAYVSKHED